MKYVKLNKTKFALVDNEDYEWLSQWKWSWQGMYAHRMDSQGKHIYMHRLIASTPKGMHTDHINGDKLDNRRSNLRVCTNAQNMRNRGLQKNNTSGFVGVNWNKGRKLWEARIKTNGKYIRLGYFNTPEEANEIRQLELPKYHKEFAHA